MRYKSYPPFLESTEQQIQQNETIAHLAELDTLLLEFEHSEEFRGCCTNYLQTPKIIVEDFIHETGLAPHHFDSESLAHGLLAVIPARIRELVPQDAHQIFREQISFWAFVSAQWQFDHALECVNTLDKSLLNKLHKIIDLENMAVVRDGFLQNVGAASCRTGRTSWEPSNPQEAEVFSLYTLSKP